MLNRRSPVPLYMQIAAELARRLQDRAPHSLFTSEHEVMQEFNVSRGTARQALDSLVNEGRLYRMVGRGTFVADGPPILRSFERLPSFKQDILRRGMEPGTRIVRLVVEQASEHLRAELRLGAEQQVWRVERVRLANGQPIGFLISWVPVYLVSELTEGDVADSLYEAMGRCGAAPRWAHDMYGAKAADAALARLLEVPAGAPLVYSERTSYLADDTPVERAISYLRADRFQIHLDINRQLATGVRATPQADAPSGGSGKPDGHRLAGQPPLRGGLTPS